MTTKYDRAAVYVYIVETMRDTGHAPTLREIGEAFGIPSTNTVAYILTELERGGLVIVRQSKAGGIDLPRPPRCACCGGIDYNALLAEREAA